MILKFVPAPKKIRDNRTNANGYYVAKCDSCGTEFYPKKVNAMYCQSKCAVQAHRSSMNYKVAAKPTKKAKKEVKIEQKPKSPNYHDADALIAEIEAKRDSKKTLTLEDSAKVRSQLSDIQAKINNLNGN